VEADDDDEEDETGVTSEADDDEAVEVLDTDDDKAVTDALAEAAEVVVSATAFSVLELLLMVDEVRDDEAAVEDDDADEPADEAEEGEVDVHEQDEDPDIEAMDIEGVEHTLRTRAFSTRATRVNASMNVLATKRRRSVFGQSNK
jgi:hypothetical protein